MIAFKFTLVSTYSLFTIYDDGYDECDIYTGIILLQWRNKETQSNRPPIHLSIHPSIHQPTNQPTSQPINQPTNQPTNQSTNQPINQSINQPINQINQAINQLNACK